VVGVAGDGEAVRFDSAEVPATMGLEDYLKSGWIAGLVPETVRRQSNNGYDMASGIAATPQWNFRVSVVRFEGRVYRFIFAAKINSDRFAKGAEATLKSFRRTTKKDIQQVRTVAIDVVTARPGDTADSLARQMAGLNRGPELFYILNDLFPGDPLVAGGKYKIVVVK
jgi:predicted Zn-dependent protease